MSQEDYQMKVDECLREVNLTEDEWGKYDILRRAYSSYVNQNRSNIKVAIVGNTPFPTEPEGIPFCRETWDKQANGNCSGKTVLETMFNIDVQALRRKFETPVHFFFWLVSQGVVFLNRFQEDVLTRDVVRDFPEKTILCGNSAHELLNGEMMKVLHPSHQAKSQNIAEWDGTWANQERFFEKIINLNDDAGQNAKRNIEQVCSRIQETPDNVG